MKKTFVFVAAISVVTAFAASAYSYTLDCASADSKLQYQVTRSDGGAPRQPTEWLRVNGQDVVNATIPGGATFRIGKIDFGAKQTLIKTTKQADYKTTVYAVTARVTDNGGNLVGEDTLLCKQVVYTGGPRP